MKLSATGVPQGAFVAPFQTMFLKPYKQTVGAGIGVRRQEPGIRAESKVDRTGKTEKARKVSNQALGETPARTGPFASGASSVATNYPTSAIKKKASVARERRTGTNPMKSKGPK